MKVHLFTSIRITLVFLLLTCGVYPAVVWAIGQLAFRHEADGSLLVRNGTVIGSELIGQNFTASWFFHPRPSAAGAGGYDATASGGTNLGPTSKRLRDSIARAVKAYGPAPLGGVPADAVTSSGSGLDPHISPANAVNQIQRVARANGMTIAQVRNMVDRRTEGRFLGVFGEPRVNVLLLNLDLLAKSAGVERIAEAGPNPTPLSRSGH
jgi:K+-transporting ATPase ATPase C chain